MKKFVAVGILGKKLSPFRSGETAEGESTVSLPLSFDQVVILPAPLLCVAL